MEDWMDTHDYISISRYGGLGDELCLTPIYKKLMSDNPNLRIIALGKHAPEILVNNPNIYIADDAYRMKVRTRNLHVKNTTVKYDLKWHCDAGYGHDMHLVDFYASQVGVEVPRELEIYVDDNDMYWSQFVEAYKRPIVCYNNDGGWRSREYRVERIMEILIRNGVIVIHIGNGKPYNGIGINMTHTGATLTEIAGLMRRCDLFVGNDSGLLHLAAAAGAQAVGIYTSVRPELRMTGTRIIPIVTECNGCYSKETESMLMNGTCPRGNHSCIISEPGPMANTIMEILNVR